MNALTTILLLPLLLIALAGSLELGFVRVIAEKARAAADLAAIVGVGDQDDGAFVATGEYRPSADAESVARNYFARNLEGIAAVLDLSVDEVAARADVAVFPSSGMQDPRTAQWYDRPAIRVAAEVPIRTPVFAALLLPSVMRVQVLAASVAR